jgi:hypothetical protein
MAKRAEGIPAKELDDDELENELRQLYRTREDTFFDGSAQAFRRHTERMLELESEYASRKPSDVEPEPERTRAGARRRSGQPDGETSDRSAGKKKAREAGQRA